MLDLSKPAGVYTPSKLTEIMRSEWKRFDVEVENLAEEIIVDPGYIKSGRISLHDYVKESDFYGEVFETLCVEDTHEGEKTYEHLGELFAIAIMDEVFKFIMTK